MVYRRAGLLAALLGAVGAQAAIVVNPVPAPVAPGMTVAVKKLGQAPAMSPAWNGATHIQQMKSANDGTGRMFINDTSGAIEAMPAGGGTPSVWFDVKAAVPSLQTNNGQQGAMSFAFHPNYNGDPAQPGYGVFYLLDTETATSGTATLTANGPVDHHNVVREFTVADPTAATATITASREVMRMTQPYEDHGPGMLSFNTTAKPGSADYGNLYIGVGDGGNWADISNNAQDLHSPAGKILRINPADPDGSGPATYTIPADNPFTSAADKEASHLPEVYAYGLRNPQSFSWDAASGKMAVIDIGMNNVEEVNLGQAGANYGWPAREGNFARSDRWGTDVYDDPNPGTYLDPILQYDHEEIFRSGEFNLAAISSAFVYNGSIAALDGMVILSDLVSGRVFYAPFNDGLGSTDMRELFFTVDGQPETFAQLEELYGRTDLRLAQMDDGEIGFLFKTTGDIFSLDALSDVPEPAGWATMILGFGMLGAGVRRKRLRIA